MKILLLVILSTVCSIVHAQDIEWANNVNYDNEFSIKDGYRARLVIGPPNAEKYGTYSKGAGTINLGKTASIWLDYSGKTATRQILILESNGAGSILKVELVDAVTGNSTPVFENPVVEINANYRLTRIVLPNEDMKAKMLKIKFSARKEKQQIDAVGITASAQEFTLESVISKYAASPPQFITEGNDPLLNNFSSQFNASNVNVLSIKKDLTTLGAGLKPGESGNLGYNINSAYEELQPLISPDGKTLFYVRDGHPENTYGTAGSQDIWYAVLNKDKVWEKSKKMPAPFNQKEYNGIQNTTPDGNTILVRGATDKNNVPRKGFSFYRRAANGWSDPKNLNIKRYDKMAKGTYSGAYLSNDGKTLLMYFNENESNNNGDLYVSFYEEGGTWSVPRSLGPVINTKDDESTMFLASDGVTLYFSSDRPGGLGKNDIYTSKRLDSTWVNWSPPVNLGPSVNTSAFDAYYSVPASGDYAYMVSARNSLGGSDIVRFKLKEIDKPNPVVLVSGRVLNAKTKLPIEASILYQILPEGTDAGLANSAPLDGAYKIVLPYGKNYAFLGKSEGFLAISDNINLSTVSEYAEINRDLYLVPVEVGETVRINNIFFDFGKTSLQPESFPELDRILKFMMDNATMEIEIDGHTDNVGSDKANLELSSGRANTVKEYLASKGIAGSRLKSNGFGETKPLDTNETEEGKKTNRRVEFVILKK